MFCIEYYHSFAYGHGEKTYKMCYSDAKDFDEETFYEEKEQEYSYSENYRGITYKILEEIPREKLELEVQNLDSKIEYYKTCLQ